MLKNHVTAVHKEVPPVNVKIRPVRVAARRQREMMAIIALSENGPEQADWMEEGDLDLDHGINIPPDVTSINQSTLPICSIEEHLSSPWEEENN